MEAGKMFPVENKYEKFYIYDNRNKEILIFEKKLEFIKFLAGGYMTVKTAHIRYKDDNPKYPYCVYETIEKNVYESSRYKFYDGFSRPIDPFFLYGDEIKMNKPKEIKAESRKNISPYIFEYRAGPVPHIHKSKWGRGRKKWTFIKQNKIDDRKDNEWRRPGRLSKYYWGGYDDTGKYDGNRNWKEFRRHQWKEKN